MNFDVESQYSTFFGFGSLRNVVYDFGFYQFDCYEKRIEKKLYTKHTKKWLSMVVYIGALCTHKNKLKHCEKHCVSIFISSFFSSVMTSAHTYTNIIARQQKCSKQRIVEEMSISASGNYFFRSSFFPLSIEPIWLILNSKIENATRNATKKRTKLFECKKIYLHKNDRKLCWVLSFVLSPNLLGYSQYLFISFSSVYIYCSNLWFTLWFNLIIC